MRVFVAGASGAVGRRLVPQLIAAGHEVTATTRSPAKVDELRAHGAIPVIADGLDAAAMTGAVVEARPDAIVHQMTALAGKPDLRHFDRWFEKTNELRTKGTEILLAAAREAGASRFVAQSYTGWSNPRTGGPAKSESDGYDQSPLKVAAREPGGDPLRRSDGSGRSPRCASSSALILRRCSTSTFRSRAVALIAPPETTRGRSRS